MTEAYPCRESGWISFIAPTMRASGHVAGRRWSGRSGTRKVWPNAAVMWDALSAAINATTGGGLSGPNTSVVLRMMKRTKLHHAVTQPSKSYTKAPRRPLDPPDAHTWYSSGREGSVEGAARGG